LQICMAPIEVSLIQATVVAVQSSGMNNRRALECELMALEWCL
jgi:hypothetical protein